MNGKTLLKQNHLKYTKLRSSTLDLLDDLDRPIDVQTLMSELSKRVITCDLVTIYRMLDAFLAAGIVKRIDFQDGKYRYELNNDHHHHLVCEHCGSIQAIRNTCLSIDEADVMIKHQFRIKRHQLEFFGLCHKCQSI